MRIAPPPKLTVSEWADAERVLSSEASAEPGRWRTDRAPYQREMLDAVNDPACETVVVMTSAQIGKTEILLSLIGYYVNHDPAPILLLQPTLEMAQAFSKDRLAPMIRDTHCLKEKFGDTKSRSSGNTLLHKTFGGGHITMAGANSPASLASRPIRILLADEVDRYPVSAGTEGDPLNLAKKRTTTFHSRKIIVVSTPTVKGASRIEMAYNESSMERYCFPCPSCGHFQQIKRQHLDVTKEDGKVIAVEAACEECGEIHGQHDWKQNGKWIADSPDNVKTRGFHLNEYVSPWRTWEEIEEDFIEAKKSPETLKTFINTSLGETWEEQGETVSDHVLYQRRKKYSAEVPADAVVITAGVDVQNDRLEMEVVAWTPDEQSYNIDFRVIRGDPREPEVWQDLDEVLTQTYLHESGHTLNISSTCIDSGFLSDMVYDFCRTRQSRRVFCVKGMAGAGKAMVSAPSRKRYGKNPRPVELFILGVDEIKGLVYSRLSQTEEGPGYCHFPLERDPEYFKQLTAEKIVKKYRKGFPYLEWVKTRPRNEALDCRAYSYAALKILNPVWQRLKNVVAPRTEQPKPKTKRTRKSGGWINTGGDRWL